MASKPSSKKAKAKAAKSTDAAGQYYGYSIQLTRCMSRLLSSTGASIGFEVVADVSVDENGTIIADEVKSGLAHNPISDRAVGLWKSLANWVEAVRSGKLTTTSQFVLYVAQPYTGTAIGKIEAAKTKADALGVIQWLRDTFWGSAPAYPEKQKLGA